MVSKRVSVASAPEILLVSISRLSPSGAKSTVGLSIDRELLAQPFDARFQFAAAATHTGNSVKGGHYVAYGKRDKDWFLFDDNTVRAWNVDSGLQQASFKQNVTFVILQRTALVNQPIARADSDMDVDD